MALLASASAATLAAPARPLLGAASAAAAKTRTMSPKLAGEIEKQKKVVADALKVIRGYPLPPGSDMAFEFRPLRAKRRK